MVFTISSVGQVNKEIIPSATGSKTSGGVSINWTLGGILIPTIATGKQPLIHGSQKQSVVAEIEEKLDFSVKPKVYPNPFTDHLIIKFKESLEGEVTVTVLDSQGRLVRSDMIESGLSEKLLIMQDLSAGIYYLRFTKGKNENVYKVVKL
jgi:hypothetical protein